MIMNMDDISQWVGVDGNTMRVVEPTKANNTMFRDIGITLSRLLQHTGCNAPSRNAIPCDTGAWFAIKHILALPRNVWGYGMNLALLLSAVRANTKNRFQICLLYTSDAADE